MLTEIFKNLNNIAQGILSYFSTKILPSFIIPTLLFLFGVHNTIIAKALFTLVMIDFITGVASSHVTRQIISSRKAIRSAYKVAVYAMLLSASHLATLILPISLLLEPLISSFLGMTELISIIENTGRMGFAIPQKLLNKLEEYRDNQ